MEKVDLWRWVFYGSLLVLSVWLILKVAGVIQTPVWAEYGIPVASLIIGLFACFQGVVESFMKIQVALAVLSTRVSHVETDIDDVKGDVRGVKRDIEGVSRRLSGA